MKIAIEGEDCIVKGERVAVLLDVEEARDLYDELAKWFGREKGVLVVQKPNDYDNVETPPIKPGPVDQKSLDRIMEEYEEEVRRRGSEITKQGEWIPPKVVPFIEPRPHFTPVLWPNVPCPSPSWAPGFQPVPGLSISNNTYPTTFKG